MKTGEKISKFFEKRSVRSGLIFALVAGISGTITYFAFPSFIQGDAGDNNVIDDGDSGTEPVESSVDRFASKLIETTGIEGQLDLTVTFPDNDGDSTTMNTISIDDASLKFAMPSTSKIGLDFEGTINYNDWNTENLEKATTHINYVDGNAYVDFWGGKIAYLDTEYKSLIGELISIFSDSVIKIPDSVYDFLDKMMGDDSSSESDSNDSSSDMSSLAGTKMDWTLVNDGENSKEYKLDIDFDGTVISLNLFSDSDYNLTRVVAKDLKFNDVTINLELDTSINEDALSSIRSSIPTDYQNYTSLLGLKGIIRKVGNAVAKERFGLDMSLNLTHSESDFTENMSIGLDGNFDFGTGNYLANLDLANAADNSYSQKLDVAYLTEDNENNAYLNYNDVTKVSTNLVTLEAMLGRMQKDGNSQDMSYLAKIFDFVFDSELINAVQKGRYELIADEIEKIEITSNKVVLKAKLDKIGLGDDSLATIVFDGTKNAPISQITLSGIKAKNFELEGNIDINSYSTISFDSTGYYKMEHLPDVFDQVSDLVDSKQATLKIEGSMLDENNYGMTFNGGTNFDANLKSGTGSVVLSQINKDYTKNHLFTLDVDEQQAIFNYNDNDKKDDYVGLNGSISLANITDLIDLIKSLTGEASFTKRFGGIFSSFQSDATTGVTNDVINGKYAPLLSTKILNSCTISSSEANLLINGGIFGLENDINVIIAFADSTKPVTDENGEVTDELIRNIKSVSLKDFVLSDKTINLTVSLEKFDNTLSSLDKTATYTDFSSVTTLAEYFLNTANELNTYHLTSALSVTLWTADVITIDADLYISIEEEGTKIYGTLSNIPLIPAVNNDTWLFGDHGDDASYYRTVEFYYDAKNIYVHGVNPFGTFDVENDEGETTTYDFTEIQDYKYETSYFSSVDNIIHFLLKDVINMQNRLLSKVDTNGISLPTSSSALATEKLFKDFSFDNENKTWDLSLDLGGLLGNDFLKDLNIKATGTSDKYLSDLNLSLTIFAGVKIEISADVSLENIGKNDFPTDSFNAYISAHENDELSSK